MKYFEYMIKITIGVCMLLSCIVVFYFSLLGKDAYFNHYPQWLLGHCIAVILLLFVYLMVYTLVLFCIKGDIKGSFLKAFKFVLIILMLVYIYIFIFGINYDLLFHSFV